MRPGSYEFALPLTDTLGLRVGTTANLTLEDAHAQTVAEGDFRFEDYELNNNQFTLRMLEKEPRRGQPQAAFMRGSDASELNLLDALPGQLHPQSGQGRAGVFPNEVWANGRQTGAN